VCAALALAVGLLASDARAATATSSFTVTGTVVANCTISTGGISFTYDPVSANASTNALAAGTVTVACTKGSVTTIDLGNGGNLAAGSRRMASGTDFLNYALYKDAARTQVWGTGLAGGTTTAYNAATRNLTAITVYGTVPQAQDVTVGAYSDTVIATINY